MAESSHILLGSATLSLLDVKIVTTKNGRITEAVEAEVCEAEGERHIEEAIANLVLLAIRVWGHTGALPVQ